MDQLPEFDRAYETAHSLVAFTMNRFIVDNMLRASRDLTDGDYEAIVIWGVLAHQNVAHLMPPGSIPSVILNEAGQFPNQYNRLRPMKLRDLAQISGIPRQTVRRKLDLLAAKGWIVKTDEGWLVNQSSDGEELRAFTKATMRRFMQTADELMYMLRNAHD